MRWTKEFDDIFKEAAETYLKGELNWLQLKAQGIAESNLNPSARSKAGAIGIMQIMPATGKELGLEEVHLYDPEKNILAGALYMAKMLRYFRHIEHPDKWFFALAAYNAGIGNVKRAIKKAKKIGLNTSDWACVGSMLQFITGRYSIETLNYVARIKRIYKILCKEESV